METYCGRIISRSSPLLLLLLQAPIYCFKKGAPRKPKLKFRKRTYAMQAIEVRIVVIKFIFADLKGPHPHQV